MWKPALVLPAFLLLAGCARTAGHGSSVEVSANSSSAISTPRVPTPSIAPVEALGPLTTPLPTGVTAVTVTFVEPGTGAKVIYGKTITDPSTMQQIISDIDGLHVAGNETRGCAPLPTGLQLEFTTQATTAILSVKTVSAPEQR
jgi:hypothetical protein